MENSIDKVLQKLSKEDLIGLIKVFLNQDPLLFHTVKDWIERVSKENNIKKKDLNFIDIELNDNVFLDYWLKAQEIISKFNEYGGGPEEEEYEAIEWLEELKKFSEKNPITKDAKHEFIEECFTEYNKGNSGLDDFLSDAIYHVCDTKEDWKLVIENLSMRNSKWAIEEINQIKAKYLNEKKMKIIFKMDKCRFVEIQQFKN